MTSPSSCRPPLPRQDRLTRLLTPPGDAPASSLPIAQRDERSQVEQAPPEGIDAGYFLYTARTAFRDLELAIGFEEARQAMAEIINQRAGGRRQ